MSFSLSRPLNFVWLQKIASSCLAGFCDSICWTEQHTVKEESQGAQCRSEKMTDWHKQCKLLESVATLPRSEKDPNCRPQQRLNWPKLWGTSKAPVSVTVLCKNRAPTPKPTRSTQLRITICINLQTLMPKKYCLCCSSTGVKATSRTTSLLTYLSENAHSPKYSSGSIKFL